jgi:serine protease inhibitor
MRRRITLAFVAATMVMGVWAQSETDEPKEITLSEAERELVSGNNGFAYDLFEKAKGDESLILSPLSITYALGMMNNGATGATQQEINQMLGFGEAGADAINNFCHKLMTETGTLDELTRVHIANNIYMNTLRGDVQMTELFEQKAHDYYDVTPEFRDFSQQETVDAINQWASDNTEGMIDKVISAEDMDPDFISYLLNAIYFKGEWTAKFDPEKTVKMPFDGGKATADMMRQQGEFLYYDNDVYQSVILPYGNKAYQMTVYLPRQDKSISDVIANLKEQPPTTSWYEVYDVNLGFPRFETKTDQLLIPIMKSLGMENAFSGLGFLNCCENLDGSEHAVWIAMMKQVAKIKVNEEGTEAAAVTIIGYTDSAVMPTDFIADRPFFYTITEQSTGVILFMGQYMGEQSDNQRGEIQLSQEEQQLVKSNNDFAFNLFREARGEADRLLSPLSITYALGMLNNGAAGQTRQEINQVLGFGDAGADAINAFCHKMMTESNTLDQTTQVNTANNIYVNQPYVLLPDFVQTAQTYYDATPESRDFADGETMDVINQWASDHTEGMVNQVLDEDTFDPEAISYQLNAIYFKGVWTYQFDPSLTKEESFNGGESVPMMCQSGEFSYAENDLYQALVMPYGNGAYRMTIFLPQKGKSVGEVLDNLNGHEWQPKCQIYEVDVKLPRFETQTDLRLEDIMSALGMPSAFIPGLADFSNFCNVSCYIDLMKQVARIEVDEEGTEAAAVTVIGERKYEVMEFHATRPFLYVISEQSSGTIFFIGQFMGKQDERGEADSIEKFTTDNQQYPITNNLGDDAVYDLQGRMLKNGYWSLDNGSCKKGVYIRDGRKIVVR